MSLKKAAIPALAIILLAASILFTYSQLPVRNNDTDKAVSSEVTEVSSKEVSSEEARERVILEFPYFIEIDKGAQLVTIFTTNELGKYEKVVRYIPISSGIDMNKLPNGYFRTKDTRHEWQTMFTISKPIYCQYTTRITGNFLFHSAPYRVLGKPGSLNAAEFNKLGTPASGGCIRMSVENAKWIYDNIKPGTTVYVRNGSPRPDILEKYLHEPLEPDAKWDPSDPDPDNPNYKTMYPDPDPQPDPYAPLYPYEFKYNKDIPVTPQKKTTTTVPVDELPAASQDTTTKITTPAEAGE